MKIFVFGSNEAGRHGAGAAQFAVKHHGAIYGKGVGLQGNSYAIPTKDRHLNVLSLEKVEEYVDEFIIFAEDHDELKFELTPIGCGLAKFTPEEIAPMFVDAPKNVLLPPEFKSVLSDMAQDES